MVHAMRLATTCANFDVMRETGLQKEFNVLAVFPHAGDTLLR